MTISKGTIRTYWFCEQCQQVAWSLHDEHADTYTVIHEIEADHKRLQPNCDNPVKQIRIINLQEVLRAQLPEYVAYYLAHKLEHMLV